MNKTARRAIMIVLPLFAGTASVMIATGGCDPIVVVGVDDNGCPLEAEDASISVAGVFDYSGGGSNAESGQSFMLAGTITFEQQGSLVRVIDTTYSGASLRRVAGDFALLQGNRLDTVLAPFEGDPNYQAEVTFLFSSDGSEFCVSFSDTNNDMGEMGSFTGRRKATE